jgi:thiamine-monophosphate kinase
VLGRSAAGLALLDAGIAAPDEGAPGASGRLAPLVAGYLRPESPLFAGPAAGVAGATAMLDVSDGLLRDAGRLARASGVVVDLDRSALERDVAGLRQAARALGDHVEESAADESAAALAWVLGGGEDHGLLATFPAGVDLPEGFRTMGCVRETDEHGPRVVVDGREPDVGPGWDHFRG